MQTINVYLISGLGTDSRAFSKIHFSEKEICNSFNFIHINWLKPNGNESIQDYAKKLSTQINLKENFILIGLSLGGMIALEMNKFIRPQKTILISSIINSKGKSTILKFLSIIPFHKSFLLKFIIASPLLLSKMFRLGKKHSEFNKTFLEMVQSMPDGFIQWGLKRIVDWDFKEKVNNVIQLHGDKDEIFKIQNPTYQIRNGSHFMVYTKYFEVKEILKKELLNSRREFKPYSTTFPT